VVFFIILFNYDMWNTRVYKFIMNIISWESTWLNNYITRSPWFNRYFLHVVERIWIPIRLRRLIFGFVYFLSPPLSLSVVTTRNFRFRFFVRA